MTREPRKFGIQVEIPSDIPTNGNATICIDDPSKLRMFHFCFPCHGWWRSHEPPWPAAWSSAKLAPSLETCLEEKPVWPSKLLCENESLNGGLDTCEVACHFLRQAKEQRGKVAKEDWCFNFGSFKVFSSNAVLERKNWLVVEQPPEQMSPWGRTLQSRVQVINESCLNHQPEGIRHKTGNS